MLVVCAMPRHHPEDGDDAGNRWLLQEGDVKKRISHGVPNERVAISSCSSYFCDVLFVSAACKGCSGTRSRKLDLARVLG